MDARHSDACRTIDMKKLKHYVVILVMMGCCVVSRADIAMTTTGNLGYVLHIQMTPAICEIDDNAKRQRKCLEGYAMTVASLVPEVMRSDCFTNTSANLSQVQSKVVARLIPDEAYRVQLWRTIGGCMPMNASQYFRTMTTFAQNLKIPTLLTDAASHTVSYSALQDQFMKLNNSLPANAIQFNCQRAGRKALLTHASICYKTNGQFKACPTQITANCPTNFNIQGTY